MRFRCRRYCARCPFVMPLCPSGFGTSTSSGGLFGSTNTTSNPFGGTTSLFGGSGFSAAQQPGTTVKFNVSESAVLHHRSKQKFLGFCCSSVVFLPLIVFLLLLLTFSDFFLSFFLSSFSPFLCIKLFSFFQPPTGSDTMVKAGVTTSINTKHQCITAMKEYENKSLEVSFPSAEGCWSVCLPAC